MGRVTKPTHPQLKYDEYKSMPRMVRITAANASAFYAAPTLRRTIIANSAVFALE